MLAAKPFNDKASSTRRAHTAQASPPPQPGAADDALQQLVSFLQSGPRWLKEKVLNKMQSTLPEGVAPSVTNMAYLLLARPILGAAISAQDEAQILAQIFDNGWEGFKELSNMLEGKERLGILPLQAFRYLTFIMADTKRKGQLDDKTLTKLCSHPFELICRASRALTNVAHHFLMPSRFRAIAERMMNLFADEADMYKEYGGDMAVLVKTLLSTPVNQMLLDTAGTCTFKMPTGQIASKAIIDGMECAVNSGLAHLDKLSSWAEESRQKASMASEPSWWRRSGVDVALNKLVSNFQAGVIGELEKMAGAKELTKAEFLDLVRSEKLP